MSKKKTPRKSRSAPPGEAETKPFEDTLPDDEDDGSDDAFPAAPPKEAEAAEPEKPKQTKRRSRKPPTNPDDIEVEVGEKTDADVGRPRQSINLDKRKLTKKQKGKLDKWSGPEREKVFDKFLLGQVAKARTKFGAGSVFVGSELDNLIVGIPCPALAFEYLICQDVFPLGIVLHLAGPPGSYKSALNFELNRWFRLVGGGGVLNENETKISPDFPRSIIGYDDYDVGLIVNRCVSVEDWMEHKTHWLTQMKKDLTGTKDEPGPGRTIPMLFSTDSIMGKLSYETQEKIIKQGSPDRAHPVEALKINQYMKTIPHHIDGWPFTIVLVNHLKTSKDKQGKKEDRTAGGQSVGFQESLEIRTYLIKKEIQSAQWDGAVVGMRCAKNSMGKSYRKIQSRILWWEELDEETGEYRQQTVWDWDWATVHLLSNIEGREASRLKEAGFHISTPTTSDVQNTAWSKNFGMKSEDAVPWHELGRMIDEDLKLKDTIRQCLSIKRRPVLEGDYQQMLEKLKTRLP
jgi:hypothetical protein